MNFLMRKYKYKINIVLSSQNLLLFIFTLYIDWLCWELKQTKTTSVMILNKWIYCIDESFFLDLSIHLLQHDLSVFLYRWGVRYHIKIKRVII